MKNIIAILFFLPLVMTDHLEEHPPDLRYDITKPFISSVLEKLRQFSSSAMTNFFREWISHHQPFVIDSVIVDSKNISFSKFISDEDITWFLNLERINCGNSAEVTFRSINTANKERNMSVEGNITFLYRNYTLTCQFSFSITINRLDIYKRGKKAIGDHSITKIISLYSESPNSDEISCEKAYEDEFKSIFSNISRIINERVTERVDLITESAIEFIYENCPHVNNKFHDMGENYYVYFKLDRNIDTFPWMHDYEEVIIRGLSNMVALDIDFNEDGEGTFKITAKNVGIYWNTTSTSVKPTEFDATVNELYWLGIINNDLNINNSQIQFAIVKAETPVMTKQLTIYMENGIERVSQSLPRNYVDIKVAKTITKILRPFDEKSFETLFLSLEKTKITTFISETMHFSIVTLKGLSRLETISCSLLEHLKIAIGTIDYEQIIAQAEYSRNVNEKHIHRIAISSNVYIKNATIRISLNRTLNSTKRFEITIEDTFNISNKMVVIEPGNYHLSRKDRTEIGKQIFDQFVNTIKDQVIETTNSMLSPILEVCENSPGKSTESRSNRYNTQEQFFASIYDRWDNATKAVDIIINGWWNYKSINIQHTDNTIIIGGLRIENVTVNVKQFDESKGIISSDYSYIMEHISLTMKHTDKDVQVKISKFAEARTNNASITSNTTTSDQNESNVMKNLELTIASYIEQSIYGDDQNYYENFQNLVAKAMRNAIREYALHYDESSLFTRYFAEKILPIIQPNQKSYTYLEFQTAIRHYYFKNTIKKTTKWQIDPLNLTIIPFYGYDPKPSPRVFFGDTFIRKEICNYSNHSLVQLIITDIPMQISGEAEIERYSNKSAGKVFFTIDIIRTKLVYKPSDKNTFQVDFDNETIQIRLSVEENEIMRNMKEADQDIIKENITEIISSLRTKQLRIAAKHFSCEIPVQIRVQTRSISSLPLEKYFYSINGTIEYTSRRFLMYYIQIYGLLNLQTVSIVSNDRFNEFEFKLANLTARILWSNYMGGLIPKIPAVNVINLQIDEISLVGKYERRKSKLIFIDKSQMKFSGPENSLAMQTLKDTLEPMVMESIQQSIKTEFNKVLRQSTFDLRELFQKSWSLSPSSLIRHQTSYISNLHISEVHME